MLTLAKVFFGKYLLETLLALVLVLAVSVTSAWYYKVSRDDVERTYVQHLADDKVAAENAIEQNTLKESVAQTALDEDLRKHKSIQARLALDNEQLKKKIGDLYATKTNADYRLASYRDRLLLNSNSGDSGTVTASDPERIAACRRELDTAGSRLSTAEEACALTTAHYNLAKGWIDSVCLAHECKDEK